MMEFKMFDQSHTVYRLQVHLPLEQNVIFIEGCEAEALALAKQRSSMLIGWFTLNQREEAAKHYTYTDIPLRYWWVKTSCTWQARKKFVPTVIRMYTVSPREVERYCLRILLLHQKGCKSFEDVRTVRGHLCDTFKEAALMMGLLQDDAEWDRALNEATLFNMPCQLRLLFAMICAFCAPTNALNVWETHKTALSEDFIRKFGNNERTFNATLHCINNILIRYGMTNEIFNLPVSNFSVDDDQNEDIFLQPVDTFIQNHISLNTDQKLIFDSVIKSIESNSNKKLLMVDGPAGSGKSFLFQLLHSYFTFKK